MAIKSLHVAAIALLAVYAISHTWGQTAVGGATSISLAVRTSTDEDSFKTHHGCADCHVLHRDNGDEASGGGGDIKPFHLRGVTPLDTCLRCHAGVAGIPDVIGADVNGLSDRAGGAFPSLGATVAGGHLLGTQGGPSAHATGVVTCTDCHDPHGNGEPRSLRHLTALPGSASFGLMVDPRARGLQRYEASRVAYGADPSTGLHAVSELCLECHQMPPDGRGGLTQGHTQHPTAGLGSDAEATVSHGDARGTTDSRHWLAGMGTGFDVPRLRFLAPLARTFDEARLVSPDNQVFCLTCHKAHGSGYGGGLAWPTNQDGSYGPAGCNQCHRKGA